MHSTVHWHTIRFPATTASTTESSRLTHYPRAITICILANYSHTIQWSLHRSHGSQRLLVNKYFWRNVSNLESKSWNSLQATSLSTQESTVKALKSTLDKIDPMDYKTIKSVNDETNRIKKALKVRKLKMKSLTQLLKTRLKWIRRATTI